MKTYIQRDENGIVVGIYANYQEGIAEEEGDDESPEILAFLSPPAPQVVTVVYGVDLWSRMTDAEADQVGAAMEQQPFRIRRIFESAGSYQSDHELWPLLVQIATTLFGEERAAQILAPSPIATMTASNN